MVWYFGFVFFLFSVKELGCMTEKKYRPKETIVATAGMNYHQSRWLESGWGHRKICSKAVIDFEDAAGRDFLIVETI